MLAQIEFRSQDSAQPCLAPKCTKALASQPLAKSSSGIIANVPNITRVLELSEPLKALGGGISSLGKERLTLNLPLGGSWR